MTPDDYPRFLIDHNGLRMGQTTDIYESWAGSLGTVSSGAVCPDNRAWSTTFNAGGTVTPGIFTSDTACYPAILIQPNNVENNVTQIYQTQNCVSINSYSSEITYVAEFVASAPSGTGSGTQTFGLTADIASGGTLDDQANAIAFVKRSTETTWHAVTRIADASTGNVDTGIAPTGVLAVGQVFRIEILGTNCKFYIDGVLHATITSNHPIATSMRLSSSVSRVSAVGGITLGPIRFSWNNLRNPPLM
jgi:hypothetical protein